MFFQQPVVDQRVQSLRENVRCDSQIQFKLVKASESQQSITHNQHPPRIAHFGQTARDGALICGNGEMRMG